MTEPKLNLENINIPISRINTLDCELLTNCRLILVHGGAKCFKILGSKAQRQNKVIKRK